MLWFNGNSFKFCAAKKNDAYILATETIVYYLTNDKHEITQIIIITK